MYKYLSKTFLVCAMIFPLFTHAAQAVRGINYDPVHSVSFSKGLGTDNKQLMQQAVFNDLDKLKDLEDRLGFKITHLKTFFTQYSSLHNLETLNMADVIYQWNEKNPKNAFTLALGVYEFRPRIDACVTENECQQWTQTQIDAVKQALSDYQNNSNPLIDRIIVGNEDLGSKEIDSRVLNDIIQIQQYIQQNHIQSVSVGTAQTEPTVLSMYRGDKYQDILNTADFIGINIYPFWSNTHYGPEGSSAKSKFVNVWQTLRGTKNWGTKPLIETEEGWPSGGSPLASLANELDYFYYWLNGHSNAKHASTSNQDSVVETSYFFALNDKLPGQGVESHWGLFSADNSSNIFDNQLSGGKTLASSIVFPKFSNFLGADVTQHVVYDKKNTHKALITACTEDQGEGTCYPLYGFQGSGSVPSLSVNGLSWDTGKNGYTQYNPGNTNQLMIDTSHRHYKSLLVILDDNSAYPGVCWIDTQSLEKLSSDSDIQIIWPYQGVPGPCHINF